MQDVESFDQLYNAALLKRPGLKDLVGDFDDAWEIRNDGNFPLPAGDKTFTDTWQGQLKSIASMADGFILLVLGLSTIMIKWYFGLLCLALIIAILKIPKINFRLFARHMIRMFADGLVIENDTYSWEQLQHVFLIRHRARRNSREMNKLVLIVKGRGFKVYKLFYYEGWKQKWRQEFDTYMAPYLLIDPVIAAKPNKRLYDKLYQESIPSSYGPRDIREIVNNGKYKPGKKVFRHLINVRLLWWLMAICFIIDPMIWLLVLLLILCSLLAAWIKGFHKTLSPIFGWHKIVIKDEGIRINNDYYDWTEIKAVFVLERRYRQGHPKLALALTGDSFKVYHLTYYFLISNPLKAFNKYIAPHLPLSA
ncbi:hypothetical protein [Chitinophaga sancti]|uniref:hypothetical protein n=1 Tax=Chitinophaga sancti TaxID=1004 RepID=UPI003F798A58